MKNNTRHVLLTLFLLLAITFTACKKSHIFYNAVINTTTVSSIKITSAKCGGSIDYANGLPIKSCGICWSTENNPTISDFKIVASVVTGTFVSTMTDLIPNTTYYVRAWAINSDTTGYGHVFSFTTYHSDAITDYDSTYYNIVSIGTQIWMAENLKTIHFCNGDPINYVADSAQWVNINASAYCYNENDIDNEIVYGNLYNWYAVNDYRGLAPIGWHVATDSDWTILTNYLGGDLVAGSKLKEAGSIHWFDNAGSSTNETGFTALPGGYRRAPQCYDFLVSSGFGCWWTSTSDTVSKALSRNMQSYLSSVGTWNCIQIYGLSVRCIKN